MTGRSPGTSGRGCFAGKGLVLVDGELVAGPGVYICNGCVTLARSWEPLPYPGRSCSFCGRWAPQAGRVTGHGTVAICDQCLDLCDEIIAEDQAG